MVDVLDPFFLSMSLFIYSILVTAVCIMLYSLLLPMFTPAFIKLGSERTNKPVEVVRSVYMLTVTFAVLSANTLLIVSSFTESFNSSHTTSHNTRHVTNECFWSYIGGN